MEKNEKLETQLALLNNYLSNFEFQNGSWLETNNITDFLVFNEEEGIISADISLPSFCGYVDGDYDSICEFVDDFVSIVNNIDVEDVARQCCEDDLANSERHDFPNLQDEIEDATSIKNDLIKLGIRLGNLFKNSLNLDSATITSEQLEEVKASATIDYINEKIQDDDYEYLNDPEGSHVFDAFIYNYGKELMQKYPQDMLRCVNGFYWNSVTATQGERVDDDPYEALISMWNKLTKENKQAVGQVLLDHLDEDDCPDLFEHVNEKVKLVQKQQEVNKQGRGR